jgi:hypothetical protein
MEKASVMPKAPQVPDRASSRERETLRVAMDDNHSPLTGPLRPGDDARVNRLVAEAVADDDESVCLIERIVEARVSE